MSQRQTESSPAAGHVLSTDEMGSHEWLDAACNLFPGLSIDCVSNHVRTAWLGARSYTNAQILEISSSSSMRVVCDRAPAAYSDRYCLAMLVDGRCRSQHAGRDEIGETGDLMLFDSAWSFDSVFPEDYHVLMWNLPREALAPMLAEPDRSIGVRIPGSVGPGAILGAYLRALLTEGPKCDPITQDGLFTHLYGLVGLTLGASPVARESSRETRRAVRRQQILTYIERHLGDPRLSAARAARDLRMSPRWLHALLEEGGISFGAWVSRRRLEECERLLTNPAYDCLSIADIAFRWGFNSLSTFNRRFRAQYGMTPRARRRRN
jgi:AraC-like DNA-binding protein